MAERFDIQAAAQRCREIVREAKRIRDGLTEDVINYYYDSNPTSEEAERNVRAGMKRYLEIAVRRIDDLLKKL